MKSRLLVFGSGELGTACALSLLAGKTEGRGEAPTVTMLSRDREYLHELQHGSKTFRLFDQCIPAPPLLSFHDLSLDLKGIRAHVDASFLCVPMRGITGRESANSPVEEVPPILKSLQQHADTPIFVFSRGFSSDGLTPLEHLERVMDPKLSQPVVVSGPLFAREWAMVSASLSNGGTSSKGNVENNGVSLTFAMDDETDAETRASVHALTERLWQRESVLWPREPGAAKLLSLVNGCALLCSMGAGMVSSEYPASVTAMMSYLQHAICATEQLVNDILNRPKETPLPACAVATLAMACTNHASREFIFGRRLNFHFRHRDAIRAVFPANSHDSLDATVSGLHIMLERKSLSSPFYEVIMDAFLTLLRASVAGHGLVKTGCYKYRHQLRAEDSLLLQHATAVDNAMISGDDKRFEEARWAMELAFGNQVESSPSFSPP